MVNGITFEEELAARIEKTENKRNQLLTLIAQKTKEANHLEEYEKALRKVLEMSKIQQSSVSTGHPVLDPEILRKQSTWENLLEIMSANNGVLSVMEAVKILTEANVFNDREHARNVIYSTLYNHSGSLQKIRKGVYRFQERGTTKGKTNVRLNNPISFEPAIARVLRDANGQPLHAKEIWQRMQSLGVRSNSKDPAGWVDRIARKISNAERVASKTWRWKVAQATSEYTIQPNLLPQT
jgi:hypothetical protein